MNKGLTITKDEQMQQIIFELKGYVDYVYLTLGGKEFSNDKLNQLLEYINDTSKDNKIKNYLEKWVDNSCVHPDASVLAKEVLKLLKDDMK